MNKQSIRNIAAAMSLTMLAASMPVSPFYNAIQKDVSGTMMQASAASVSGECGEKAYYEFDDTTGKLSITGEGAIKFRAFDSAHFNHYKEIISVEIGEGITEIGDEAFHNCPNIESVTFAEGSKLTTIGIKAFRNCVKIKNITIPANVTSIGENAFHNCPNIESVTFAAGSQLKTIGTSAFGACKAFTDITLPDSVTTLGEDAFGYCEGLISITFSDSLETIGKNAFYGCSALTSITIPDSVKSIENQAFRECKAIESITFTGAKPEFGEDVFIMVGSSDTPVKLLYPSGDSSWDGIEDAVKSNWNGCKYLIAQAFVAEPKDYYGGDVNFDKLVDSFDLILLKKLVISQNPPESADVRKAADVNGDGTVNTADAVMLQNYILGRITEFPER